MKVLSHPSHKPQCNINDLIEKAQFFIEFLLSIYSEVHFEAAHCSAFEFVCIILKRGIWLHHSEKNRMENMRRMKGMNMEPHRQCFWKKSERYLLKLVLHTTQKTTGVCLTKQLKQLRRVHSVKIHNVIFEFRQNVFWILNQYKEELF